jgi:hypothetical protein
MESFDIFAPHKICCMKKAVSFERYDSEQHKKRDQSKQQALISDWQQKEKATIVKRYEVIAPVEEVFETVEWLDLERFVTDKPQKILSIVTARFSVLVKDDIFSVMEKAEYFQKKGIEMSLASKE